ncbi:Protein transport protein Sec61 subunit beta [Yarrowia sp. C11]|nr:Protein transport protein Sec61 subunit beta [Yarrowia sp. C11]KAG5364717.1 Protein transport protein Sec61 subunit beta [Yarrowia sp. E02]
MSTSAQVPGGPAAQMKRRNNAQRQEAKAAQRPTSTRSVGAGGSSSTMLKLYTDESQGLKVDPVVVMVLSLGFIFSVVALHILAKVSTKLLG